MDFHNVIVARMQGDAITGEFERYRSLVQSGIAGFVVFAAELDELRETITRLQGEAPLPLIIASDLEQGLGQQVAGGTLFPPARAMAEATRGNATLRRHALMHMALETRASGINTVLAPVLDVDSNPDNPIISTRAYGTDAESVSKFAKELIQVFESHGLRTCGKHFPGHGNTSVDSHLGLPVLDKDIKELERLELKPFRAGVNAGASMMMLAHMSVPALDTVPTSVSAKAVRLLREELGFRGIITTDALDMGALKEMGEAKASELALKAGVDIILHPSDPGSLAQTLAKSLSESMPAHDSSALDAFRGGLHIAPEGEIPPGGKELSLELSRMALRISGRLEPLNKPTLVVVSDEGKIGETLAKELGLEARTIHTSDELAGFKRPPGQVILAVFSSIRAFKGGASPWLRDAREKLKPDICMAFGPPALLEGIDLKVTKVRITAWWDGEAAQKAAAEVLSSKPADK